MSDDIKQGGLMTDLGRVLEDWRPEDAEFWQKQGPADRPAQPVDLDPLPAAGVLGLAGLECSRHASQ
ncbi:MAG: hypothetical protein U5K33_00095 [Halofilum sp. (in: g-proteobacteria)]|nr:hypothetical protein [Halofilum sp. (in: g-proteobacteria)]